MKRYILFAGCNYYPDGGWDDMVKDFDSMEDAIEWASNPKNIPGEILKQSREGWWHLVDIDAGEKVTKEHRWGE